MVEKDRSLEGFIEAGFVEFAPLVAFRDLIAAWRNDPEKRQARRRNGAVTVTARGTYIPGPFTPTARRALLKRLLALQDEVRQPLISSEEVMRIQEIWASELTGDWDAA